MSENQKLILICIAAYILIKKTGVRPRAGGGYRPPVDNTKNMQNAMWGALLGDVWHGVMGNAKNTAGQPILSTNGFGQTVTDDGIPIDSVDFSEDFGEYDFL